MGRVSDIITRARDTLADVNKERWTDARLLRILDEGQKQIVLIAKLLRTKATIPILIGVADYSVPTDCYKIIRILVDGKKVPLQNHEEMDDFAERNIIKTMDSSWESYVGSPVTRIVFDKLNFGTFKTYPIPESVEGSWTVSNSDGSILDIPYGLIVGATGYTISSPYGISVGFSDDYTNQFQNLDVDVDDNYGLCTIFDDDSTNITIYYLKRPTELAFPTGSTDLDDVTDPEIDIVWDTALKYYVTGMALRDDKDTQNRAVGNEELGFFSSNVDKAIKDAAEDFLATRTQYNSTYNNGLKS